MLPAIGDSPGRPLAHFFATLCGPIMTPRIAAMARGLGFESGEHLFVSGADITRRMRDWQEGKHLSFGISAYYLKKAGAPDPKELSGPASASIRREGTRSSAQRGTRRPIIWRCPTTAATTAATPTGTP